MYQPAIKKAWLKSSETVEAGKMKNSMWRLSGGLLLAALIFSIPFLGSVSAHAGLDDLKFKTGGGRLQGTWDVQVTLRNCQTDEEIRTFASTTTFMFGGTLLDSTSGIPQAAKTPGHGVWSHVGANIYRFKFKSFSFDPSGNFTGWTIITHEASMDPGGDSYESAGIAEVYNPAGILIVTGCSTTTATRFQ